MFTQEIATETVLTTHFVLTQQRWANIHKVHSYSSLLKLFFL